MLAIIFLVSLILRLFQLNSQSLWLDEMTSIEVARTSADSILLGHSFNNHTPPFYYLILHYWFTFFSVNEFNLRLFSVLMDSASFWVFIALAGRYVSSRGVLISGAFFALNPFIIYYAQEGRMYSLLLLICLLTWELSERVLATKSKIAGIGFGIVVALGFYTHYYYPFFLAGLLISLLLREERASSLLKSLGAPLTLAVMAFIPWLPVVRTLASSGGQEFRNFHTLVIPYALFRFVAGYGFLPIIAGYKENLARTILNELPSLLLIAFFIAPAFVFGLKKILRSSRKVKMLLGVLCIPCFLAWIISFKVPMLSERYLIVSIPAFLLLAVSGCEGEEVGSKLRLLGVIGAFVIATFSYFFNPDVGKADWKGAASFVQEQAKEDSLVLLNPNYIEGVFKFYFKGDAPVEGVKNEILPEELNDNFILVEDGVAHPLTPSILARGFSEGRIWFSKFDNGITVKKFSKVQK